VAPDNQHIGKTKVEAPVKTFTGAHAHGVVFVEGVAYTDNVVAIQYFARHGYKITGPDAPKGKVTTVMEDQSVAVAPTNPSHPGQDAGVAAGMDEESRREAFGEGTGPLLDYGTEIQTGPATIEYPSAHARGKQIEAPAAGPTAQRGVSADEAADAAAAKREFGAKRRGGKKKS
jgi:hypothetical protein